MPRRRGVKKIDYTHWITAFYSFAAQAAGTAAATVFVAQHLTETLLRLRGNLSAYVDNSQAPGVSARFGIGLIYVPEGTGTTVLWSPISDSDAPWVWVDYFHLAYEEMVVDVIDVPVMTGYRSIIDNKAMRIVRNQELQAVVENVTLAGAVSGNI